MSEAAEQVLALLWELPVTEQRAVAEALNGALSEDDDESFIAELNRRSESLRNGSDPGISAEEVRRRVMERYGK